MAPERTTKHAKGTKPDRETRGNHETGKTRARNPARVAAAASNAFPSAPPISESRAPATELLIRGITPFSAGSGRPGLEKEATEAAEIECFIVSPVAPVVRVSPSHSASPS